MPSLNAAARNLPAQWRKDRGVVDRWTMRHRLWIGLIVIMALSGFSLSRATAPQPARSGANSLSLLTYNLHAETIHLEPMVELIRAADADIVATQETSPEMAEALRSALGETYPHIVENLEGGRWNGQLILSRYPILVTQLWEQPRRLMSARIDLGSTPITVFNLHPTSPGSTGLSTRRRSRDITFALEQAEAVTDPVILMGDFNLEEWSEDYSSLAAVYTDAFATVGEGTGLTYPDYSSEQARLNHRLPVFTPLILRLDYIFHSAFFVSESAEVWSESGGSDHRPVYAVLRWDAPES
jgi:vancomycin resistance protein VanJ